MKKLAKATQSKCLSAILGIGLFMGAAHQAGAALVSVDLFASGDGLATLDTSTGLEWVDLTQTLGLSYNQVMAGGGTHNWVALGFSYGNTTQVGTLFNDAGIANINGTFNVADYGATLNLLSLVGQISTCGGGEGYSYGTLELDPANATMNGTSALQACFGQSYVIANYGPSNKAEPWTSNMGSWLQREAVTVPEPSLLALFGLGFAGLGWARRKKA